MEKLDPTILVALVSLVGIIISAAFGLLVAVVTNRKETKSSAEEAADQTLETAQDLTTSLYKERLAFKDEQIAQSKLIIIDQAAEIARLKRKCGE